MSAAAETQGRAGAEEADAACQPPADSFFGLVTRSMGGFYNVRTQARTYACKPRGIFRKEKTILLVGDRVRIEQGETSEGTTFVIRRMEDDRPAFLSRYCPL